MDTNRAELLHQVRWVASRRQVEELPDAALLERFVQSRDELAFAALVQRHGPMVLRLCRRVLADAHAAEDAFQATFLVLSRRAGGVRQPEHLAAWLHGVAYRVACKARAGRPRRETAQLEAPVDPHPDPLAQLSARNLLCVLDEEVQRLPAAYRLPVILCCLEGHSQEEAARRLGWSAGSVKGRLERGRAQLRRRLTRRGIGLPAALAVVSAGECKALAALPAALAGATVRAARACEVAASTIPMRVLELAEAGLQGSGLAKVRLVVGLVLLAGALAAGTRVAVVQLPPAATPAQAGTKAEAPPPAVGPMAGTDLHGDPLPEGARARLGTIRLRHEQPSLHLLPAFSPDGKLLATSHDGIRLWETGTGKLLREIADRDGYNFLASSPDGGWLAASRWLGWEASRQAGRDLFTTRLWDLPTGQPRLDIPTDGCTRACSPDGKQLVTTAKDGSISLWDTATGQRTLQLRGGHTQPIDFGKVAFTADGKGIVTVCAANRACHWDLASGRLEKTVPLGIPRQVNYVCLSPDGQSLAVSPRGGEPVFVLDTVTGKERLRLQGELAQGGQGLAFSPDGATLATSQADPCKWTNPSQVALWDTRTGELRRHFGIDPRAALYLRFSPDGRTLLLAGQQAAVHLRDVATGRPLHEWASHVRAVVALAFTPDGQSVVSGSLDGSARLWEAQTGRHLRELPGHRGGVLGVAVMPDGKAILTGGDDGCLRLQHADGTEVRRMQLGTAPAELEQPQSAVRALQPAPDGKTVAVYAWRANAGAFYQVWDTATGELLRERRDTAPTMGSRAFSPDVRRVARILYQYANVGSSPSGDSAAPPAGPTRAVIEDVATGKQVASLELPARAGSILEFVDNRSLLTSNFRNERRPDGWHFENTLHLWELASGKARRTITWSGAGSCRVAAIAPGGDLIATACDDRTIQLWDLATGQERLRRGGFLSGVTVLAFSGDGRSLASGHADGTMLVWDLGAEDTPR